MNYRRVYQPGGTFFFTVITYNRINYFSKPSNVELLGDAFRYVLKKHPCNMMAYVIMPEHLHVIWQLPEGDANYSTRWRLIKSYVSRNRNMFEDTTSDMNDSKGRQPFWQNQYWEHTIQSQDDLDRHFDYIHYNPVKHRLVDDPIKWKYSSFSKYLEAGEYLQNWEKKGTKGYIYWFGGRIDVGRMERSEIRHGTKSWISGWRPQSNQR
jgi:putative transposase